MQYWQLILALMVMGIAPQSSRTGFLRILPTMVSADRFEVVATDIERVATTTRTRLTSRTTAWPPQKSANMLNYIFDSHATSSRHYHDMFRAPTFDDDINKLPNGSTVEVDTGTTVLLDCGIIGLRDKLVSWMKYTGDGKIEILTLNLTRHTADSRFRMRLGGDNWQLVLTGARVQDSGFYRCHISAYPPLMRQIKLFVNPPEITLTKEAFLETSETLSLKCMIHHLHCENIEPRIRWYRNNSTQSLDEVRGGVYVLTDHLNLTSHLQMASLRMTDAGNYTCALEAPIVMRAVARVHVLKGSSLAELHSGVKTSARSLCLLLAPFFFMCLYRGNR